MRISRGTKAATVGRTKTVLVSGDGVDAVAVTTHVVARVLRRHRGAEVEFTGPVSFGEKTVAHIRETVLPLVDTIRLMLKRKKKHIEISAVNVGAASVHDVGVHITGMSADLPVFLAVLSAYLRIPVPDDLVCTGHIASGDGDIRLVRNIPAKVAVAVADPTISTFICPSLDGDMSMPQLSPAERERIQDAICTAKQDLRIVVVGDVREALTAVLSEEAVVQGGLCSGVFGAKPPKRCVSVILRGVVRQLVGDWEARFTKVLEAFLLAGDVREAQSLLDDWAQFHIRRRQYPQGFGQSLRCLLASLPPAVRRLKLKEPLLPVATCKKLIRFAADADDEDAVRLFATAAGVGMSTDIGAENRSSPELNGVQSASRSLEIILSEIDRDNLTAKFGIPIDSARACYALQSVTVRSNEEFMEVITAFYLHLLRHVGSVDGPCDAQAAEPEAHALLCNAFQERGGRKAALAEARTATNGGMRLVLDLMTDRFKCEQVQKFVDLVFSAGTEPDDWESKVALLSAFMERYAGNLPPDITSQPPERFAHNWEAAIRAYCSSFESVKQVLRTM